MIFKVYFPLPCWPFSFLRDCIVRKASSGVVDVAFFLISSHTFSGSHPLKGLKIEAERRSANFVFLCDMLFEKFQLHFGMIKQWIGLGTYFTIKPMFYQDEI